MTHTKARITTSPATWLEKKVHLNHVHKDPFNEAPTRVSVFVPQPTVQKTRTVYKPCAMLHLVNGAGRILVRFEDPNDLKTLLSEMSELVGSERFEDAFQQSVDEYSEMEAKLER